MTSTTTDKPISYAGYRFPPEVISYAVWLYFRFPLSLHMVEEMLAARGIEVTYETVRRWAWKFETAIAQRIRSNAPACGDKWHLDHRPHKGLNNRARVRTSRPGSDRRSCAGSNRRGTCSVLRVDP